MEKNQTLSLPFGRDVIETILPHRGVALVLDEITKIEPNLCEAKYNITSDCPLTDGHYSDKRIVPGHWLSEMGSQACAFIVMCNRQKQGEKPYITKVNYETFLPVYCPRNEGVIYQLRIKATINIDSETQKITGLFEIFSKKRLVGKGSVNGEFR